MKHRTVLTLSILLLLALACQIGGGPAAEELAQTMVAETAQAASPTATEIPTKIPTPSTTPSPTLTPTRTPTPGPVTFKDDFSNASDYWLGCKGCKWRDQELYMGPYKVEGDSWDQYHYTICEPCGTATYYRVAVDATFADGYVDRFFGLLVGLGDTYMTYLGISPYQLCILGREDLRDKTWNILNASGEAVFNGMIKPGYKTNHLEVIVKPTDKAGTADMYVNLNGKTSFVIYGVQVEPAQVGLYIDWHSVGVAYDNFEYEEIEVP